MPRRFVSQLQFARQLPVTRAKQILVADDDKSVRHAIRTFIENRSLFEVTEAVDGTEALQKRPPSILI